MQEALFRFRIKYLYTNFVTREETYRNTKCPFHAKRTHDFWFFFLPPLWFTFERRYDLSPENKTFIIK